MTLSKKLHGADAAMREAIVATVSKQLKLNASWQSAARELYDGYNSGKALVREQALPNYLQAVKKATAGSTTQMAAARKALHNIERLADKGAPTRMLKAACEKLLKQVQEGSAEALEKACRVAVQEKSRYVADRIIRTEMARAWADGFFASAGKDADVIGYRWKLSTRHPVYDVCDMLLKADMFGMGAGVFPKDKAPSLPVHPHCMCSLVEAYEGDLNAQQLEAYKSGKSRAKQAGDTYLKSVSQTRRQQLLGVDGAKAWANGADWQRYMRGWSGLHNPSTRLQHFSSNDIIEASKSSIILPDIKFIGYALDPIKAPDKAKAFELALGYKQSNYEELKSNIMAHLNESKFVEKGDGGFGMRYEYIMELVGANGKKANVLTAWIEDGEQKRLTSVYVTKRKVTT